MLDQFSRDCSDESTGSMNRLHSSARNKTMSVLGFFVFTRVKRTAEILAPARVGGAAGVSPDEVVASVR